MQLKHKHLINLLEANNFKITTFDVKINKDMFFNSDLNPLQMYSEMGGVQDNFPYFEKTWYLTEPNIVIVLDDYLHFNRYRNVTLRSGLYEQIPLFPLENYRRYCRNFEKECLKSGMQKGVWSNRESDYYFGTSAKTGDFFKNGSSGWKLRAFQDFLEDSTALILNYKLIRFSVYDNFLAEGKLIRLDSILERAVHPLHNQLLKYLARRMID